MNPQATCERRKSLRLQGITTFVLLICLLAQAPTSLAQKIPWSSGYLLTWDDFQGPPPAGSSYSAETRWDFRYNYTFSGDGTISVKVDCSFNKLTSWKRPERKLTPQLLLHEQLHFQIAEIHARKMRQAYADYASTHKYSPKTNDELNQIFNKFQNECNNYQSKYDTETEHGMRKEQQEEWRKKIVSDLKELEAWQAK